jgi:dTDP-4-dehydrorhamnose 3,5-epimerase
MIAVKTTLDGLYEIHNKVFEDHRGGFVKTFHEETFRENNLETNFKESFYSVSKKGVLRGMHFQKPPHDHVKLVYVTNGEILDVALDIRPNSESYGQCFSVNLSKSNAKSLYIPKGFAHGFLTLSESATVVYLTSTVHNPTADTGIHWNSFGFDWKITQPIISERDSNFIKLKNLHENK